MTMSMVTQARQLEAKASELEGKADELEAEQLAYFSPRRRFFWNVGERVEKYRSSAGELREQARELRRASA